MKKKKLLNLAYDMGDGSFPWVESELHVYNLHICKNNGKNISVL